MNDPSAVSRDLQFVRSVVDASERTPYPRSVAIVWGLLVLVGFALPDFVGTGTVARFWMFAGPAGLLFAAWMSARGLHRFGQSDWRSGRRELQHWALFLLAIGAVMLLPNRGMVDWKAIAPISLLLVAFAYVVAGVHLRGFYFFPGLAFFGGYCLLVFRIPHAWTITGVLGALALILSALVPGSAQASREP